MSVLPHLRWLTGAGIPDCVKGAYFHIRWFLLFTLLKREFGPAEKVHITCQVIKCIDVEWESKDEEERDELL